MMNEEEVTSTADSGVADVETSDDGISAEIHVRTSACTLPCWYSFMKTPHETVVFCLDSRG